MIAPLAALHRRLLVGSALSALVPACALDLPVPPPASGPAMVLTPASAAQAARALEQYMRDRLPTVEEQTMLDLISLPLLRAETSLRLIGRNPATDLVHLNAAGEDRLLAFRRLRDVPSASRARLSEEYRLLENRLRRLEAEMLELLSARSGTEAGPVR